MAREQNIPLFLWVAAAILAHLIWGGGADQASAVLQERAEVQQFAASVQRHLRDKYTTQITLFDDPSLAAAPAVSAPEPDPADIDPQLPPKPDDREVNRPKEQAKVPTDKAKPPKPRAKPPEEKKKPPAPKPKPKAAKKEPEKEKPKAAPAPKAQPKIEVPKRVAVDQHVEDPNQADNPNAEFIGDKANRVEKQTQARITATDQNDAKPSPGTAHNGPSQEPGNAHVSDLAHSDDSPGEMNRAPSADQLAAAPKQSSSSPQGVPEVASQAKSGAERSVSARQQQQELAAVRQQDSSPQVQSTAAGAWAMAKERNAQQAQSGQAAQSFRAARGKGNPAKPLDMLGLGATGVTERGVSLNLTPGTAMAAIGKDRLEHEIKADGERRRSKHRGSWRTVGIERWRAAIENYTATVALGNQTQLNTAQKPFASYLNRIHNRLHPIFAINYLGFLDSLPPGAGLQQNIPQMKTNLEIVLNQQSGAIVKMGVTRSSGVTVFDISVLESVQRASPFGPPPSSIVSPDGNVYLHWEFHRNPIYACSTYFARPYIIKAPQKSAPASEDPPEPFSPTEGSVAPAKHGSVRRPASRRRLADQR